MCAALWHYALPITTTSFSPFRQDIYCSFLWLFVMKMLPMKKLYKKERANMQIHTGEPKYHSTAAPKSSCAWVRAQNPTEFTLSINKMGKNIHFGK